MKTLVVVNPSSAAGNTGRQWVHIEPRLRAAVGSFEVRRTQRSGHATTIVREAADAGVEWVIAVGGDGTLNETINGALEDAASPRQRLALSIITSGTGGDLRRSLERPRNIDEQIAALARGRERRIDLGKITYRDHDGAERARFFHNIASFGMSGEVDRRVNESTIGRYLGGSAAFLLATLTTLLRYRNAEVALAIDDEPAVALTTRLVLVANGQYAGGGMHFAPHARLDDGLLDLVILGDVGRMRTLRHLPDLYVGRHLRLDGVRWQRAKRLRASSAAPVLLDVDGEQPGRLPATFEVVPAALALRG